MAHTRMGPCQQCGAERVAWVNCKPSDTCSIRMARPREKWRHGFVPTDMNLQQDGDENYVDLRICLECGQLQGSWPLPETALERGEHGHVSVRSGRRRRAYFKRMHGVE